MVEVRARYPHHELSSQTHFCPSVAVSARTENQAGLEAQVSEYDYNCLLAPSCTPYENPFCFLPPLTDSVVSASREIAAFFPDFSKQRWYEEEEPQLRCGPVRYSPEGGIHCVAGAGDLGPACHRPGGL